MRIPEWLRTGLPTSATFGAVRRMLRDLDLNTVCQSAKCPNMFECFSRGVATFLILGDSCTRNCRFCNIGQGRLIPPDPREPARIAEAVGRLKVSHVVLTSVTRDDLPDGGAGHFVSTISVLRANYPLLTIEVLIPDFQGDPAPLRTVTQAGPDILNHNLETVPGLYAAIRPQAEYQQSLELLQRVKRWSGIPTKSGIMVGLGETDHEVESVLDDLAAVGCDIVTIGQYMRPSHDHPPVERYVEPGRFEAYAEYGRSKGIEHMYCAPLVRSSYNASRFLSKKA